MGARAALSRPGAWLCLLGSIFALIAFFLPAFGPALAGFPLGSLWDFLLFLMRQATIIGLVLLLLLVSLVSLVVLAFLAVFSGRFIRWYGGLAFFLTIIYLIVASLIGLFLVMAAMEEASVAEVLGWVHVGTWLLPTGLIMTLSGCHLLWGPKRKAVD